MKYLLALIALLPIPAAAQEPQHVVAPVSRATGATTPESFAAHTEEFAARTRAQAPGARADRYGTFDQAAPRDMAEYQAMKAYGVVLVGAFSRDHSELPLAYVYVQYPDGHRLELQRLGTASRTVPAQSATAALFGVDRTDAFYLLPVSALQERAQLLADFARNRTGFVLARALQPSAKFVDAPSLSGPPPRAAVQAMLDREYPGFGIAISEGDLP